MASPNSLLCDQASTVANPSCVIPERTDFFSPALLMDRSHNSEHQEFLFFESPSMPLTPHWSVQRQAADCLGVSERTLHRWRSCGLLKPGEHYRRKFPSPNSPLLYHLERCEEAMNHACARPWQQLERAPEVSRSSLGHH